MSKFGALSESRLLTCSPHLVTLFRAVVLYWDCSILCGHRTKAEQEEAFLAGRSKARWPDSKHNATPSLAVDVSPFPIDWDDPRRFYYFAGYVKRVADELGISVRWGGDWDGDLELKDQNFHDLPHWELR